MERDRSATPASQSSTGTPIATSVSSALSMQSPAGTGPPKRGRPKGSKTGMGRGAAALAAQAKRPSPPRPPPPPQPDYLTIGAPLHCFSELARRLNTFQTWKEKKLAHPRTQTSRIFGYMYSFLTVASMDYSPSIIMCRFRVWDPSCKIPWNVQLHSKPACVVRFPKEEN